IIPGSSIGPVYADAEVNYAGVRAITDDVIAASLRAIADATTSPQGSLIVFNPTSWLSGGMIVLDASRARDMPLPQQPLPDGRVLAWVGRVPALGYVTIAPRKDTPPEALKNDLTVTPTLLENRFLRVELNERGQITRLLDKTAYSGAGREVMRDGERANVFQLFEDRPLNFDAWDIDAFYEEKSWELDHLASVEVVEQGPLRAGLRLRWDYLDRTTITQTLYLEDDSRRLDFVTEVDWHERQTLLKVAFPVDIHNGQATAEIQFGNITRPTHRNTSWDRARFETCGHKWIDLSEGDYGVALLNDCKYGYDIHDHTLRQTLLKGAISPDPDADLGHHQFTYSLFPHEGSWFSNGVLVHRAAYALNYPLLAAMKTDDQQSSAPSSCSLAESDAPHVVVETAKRAEDGDGLILRVYECANRRGPFQLRLPFAARRVIE
ncbi:MAG TPA: glycoside hydrolase family 38 C-terminal domain-containing protein, partial [Ktedonobacterales bacterium]|nr:glycoside hydrolase family 38 C-terminal domain-containing protein [Ktedonobacterales bacterium]